MMDNEDLTHVAMISLLIAGLAAMVTAMVGWAAYQYYKFIIEVGSLYGPVAERAILGCSLFGVGALAYPISFFIIGRSVAQDRRRQQFNDDHRN